LRRLVLTARGEVRRNPDDHGGWEYPEGEKPQESYAPGFSLNRFARWRTPELSNTLKAVITP
jgi:hypothetical protein